MNEKIFLLLAFTSISSLFIGTVYAQTDEGNFQQGDDVEVQVTQPEEYIQEYELIENSDGSITKIYPDGTTTQEFPDGTTVTIDPYGKTTVNYPDGRIETIFVDGMRIINYPSGRVDAQAQDGTWIEQYPDGKTITRFVDGTIITMMPDGTEIREYPNGVTEEFAPKDTEIMQETDEPIIEESTPSWIKDNAMWWSQGLLTDLDFANGIGYMIQHEIITVPGTNPDPNTAFEIDDDLVIDDWIKNNAAWWAEGLISDTDFIAGIEFLVSTGIIDFASSGTTYVTTNLDDENTWYLLNQVEHLVSLNVIANDGYLNEGNLENYAENGNREEYFLIPYFPGSSIGDDFMINLEYNDFGKLGDLHQEVFGSVEILHNKTPPKNKAKATHHDGELIVDKDKVTLVLNPDDPNNRKEFPFVFEEQDIEEIIKRTHDTDVPVPSPEQIERNCSEEGHLFEGKYYNSFENAQVFSKIVSKTSNTDENYWYSISVQKVEGYDCVKKEFYTEKTISYICSTMEPSGEVKDSVEGFVLERGGKRTTSGTTHEWDR